MITQKSFTLISDTQTLEITRLNKKVFGTVRFDIYCPMEPSFSPNSATKQSLILKVHPCIELDIETDRNAWKEYPQQMLGLSLTLKNPEFVHVITKYLQLIGVSRDMKEVKLVTIDLPSFYVMLDSYKLFDVSYQIGDERSLKKTKKKPKLNELTLQFHNRTFAIIIDDNKMGT